MNIHRPVHAMLAKLMDYFLALDLPDAAFAFLRAR